MIYHVLLSEQAKKQLSKMDKPTASRIITWLNKNIEGCSDPYQHGKGLTANHRGKWRYRVGDYGILAEIQEKEIQILVLRVSHRKDVYS